ncbi:MAG: guanylate kinase [Firmicutes bacterium]|nr:guanylate kinase [Bacillota bacterium]
MQALFSGLLMVVSGPSGVGKGTVCKLLCEMDANIVLSVSAATREPRPHEREGEHYYFLSRQEFLEKIAAGEFLEWAEVYGNFYGTLTCQVQKQLKAGKDVILEIDTQGAMQIRSACPDAVFVFIMPPSYGDLQNRLKGRAADSAQSISLRLSKSAEEMSQAKEYDYRIVNNTAEQTAEELLDLLNKEKCRRRKVRKDAE